MSEHAFLLFLAILIGIIVLAGLIFMGFVAWYVVQIVRDVRDLARAARSFGNSVAEDWATLKQEIAQKRAALSSAIAGILGAIFSRASRARSSGRRRSSDRQRPRSRDDAPEEGA